MSEARVNNLSNESNTGGPTIAGITTFSSPYFFVPPVGDTAERPENPEKGSLRFNTDSKHLEYFRGDTIGWVEVEASNNDLGGGTGSNTGTGARGFQAGYHVSGDTIEYITISTLGDSQDFGNLSAGRYNNGYTVGNENRMVFAGGYYVNTIDYWTVQSLGNAVDFGDLTEPRQSMSGVNDKTRGIWAGGQGPGHSQENTIDYVAIQSTGNAVDFGDLNVQKNTYSAVSSSTRGIWCATTSYPVHGDLQYVNIRTTGNTVDFGTIGVGLNFQSGGGSSATRGMFSGGYIANAISYVTMATTGNSVDFGDTTTRRYYYNNMTSPTRCVFGAGLTMPGSAKSNVIDYVEIATTGNAVDFGDMAFLSSQGYSGGGSNAHGGVSG
jgi:hypothetical protein